MEINGEFPTFIVEGEIDALSVVQAVGHLGISCVATGGASKYGNAVVELEKRFRKWERKPMFLVMYDNDEAGNTNGLKLVKELREGGYPAELFFLSEQMAEEGNPKVDANDLLQSNVEELVLRLLDGLEKNKKKLEKQREELKANKGRKKRKAGEGRKWYRSDGKVLVTQNGI